MSRVQFEENKVVLRYEDWLGRPREALLMYRSNSTLQWISPHFPHTRGGEPTTVTIGTIETGSDGELYLKIPVR